MLVSKSFSRSVLLILLLIIVTISYAQKDSLSLFRVNGYFESYYSHDFANPLNSEKPDFNYNYKKHNQPNVNLAFVKANYQSKRFRSNLALMTGTYVKYNLSAEPNWAKPLLETNIGYKPFEMHDFWIDAGVMPSHIGFESAVGSDCWNLTRSILAENSPYYESGIKLNYTNQKQDLYFAFHILNGWQKIAITNRSENPSAGIQINYKPTGSLTLNYSNFLGNINIDSTSALRVFHNLYAIYDASSKLSFILGFDLGTQKSEGAKTSVWYTPVIISKINLSQKSKIAGRLEYYRDKEQTIIKTSTPNGYQTFGASVNYDYQISSKVLWRTEFKKYSSRDAIFRYAQNKNDQTTATMALIVKL